MASSSSQSGGVLFVYEEDGLDWVKYLMRQLRGPAYSIPCASSLWHKLDHQLTSCNPVHVLFLTPEMAAHVSEIKYDLLNYASETSLLVDCNSDDPLPGMVEWATKHTLSHCEENQQALLATIIESYETAVNCVPDVEIVPTMIYPGQEEIYVLFNTDQQDCEIIVKIDGIVKLRTRKFSDHIFACDIPQITCGKKRLDVYKNNTTIPIYTTTVSVVTVRAILLNLIDNLDSVYGTSSESESETHNRFTRKEMGIHFNPFHKASDNELMGFTEQVNQLYTNSEERDSGFVPDSNENDGHLRESQNNTNRRAVYIPISDESQGGHIRRSDESHSGHRCRSDELQGEHLRRSDESQGRYQRGSDESQDVHLRSSGGRKGGHLCRSDELQGRYQRGSDESQGGHLRRSDELQEKFMSMDKMNASMPNLLDPNKIEAVHLRSSGGRKDRDQRRPDELQDGHLRRSDELQCGHLRRSDEMQAVYKGSKAPKTRREKFLEFIGRGPSKSENDANAVKNPRRKKRSIRVTKAMNTKMTDVPSMPRREGRQTSNFYTD